LTWASASPNESAASDSLPILGQKQELFSRLLPRLIDKAHSLGFEVRLKELQRPEEMAEIYSERGMGVSNSLHLSGLAIDLVLFKRGQPLVDTADYLELGEFWESLDILCAWGGRFGDGGHFSVKHRGYK
jgi:hypothetical protein